jgi:large subunit ribosomal protein L28
MRERKCDLSGTRKNSKAMSVSKSNVHTHRTQNVNLQTCRFWWAEGNKFVRLRISTRTLKTIKKNGLHRTAKKFGVNLNNFSLSSGTAPSTIPKMETNQEHDGEPSEHFENSIDHATSSVDSLNQPILSPTFLR